MKTECNSGAIEFQALGKREVVADFEGGTITSDGGMLLLAEVERGRGIIRGFSKCFKDHRDPERIEHSVEALMAQRIYALAQGYEDVNDHETLRRDPLLALAAGKADPTGQDRGRARDKGCPLAGKSALNRLELTPADATASSRYQKIVCDGEAVDLFFVELFLSAHAAPPEEITIDVDATEDILHGMQEGRFFHGYYGTYCYLPLYIFCGDFMLCARLRPSNIDASAGTADELKRIVARIRQSWPETRITIRGDSGFAREEIMAWCESEKVQYVLGLAQNKRLNREIAPLLAEAKEEHGRTGQAARRFKDFNYRTLKKTWSRERRVVAKAEHLEKGANPRFIVTSVPSGETAGRELYEKVYCARGEMENRIKEQQLDMFADRTSCATMRANQLRLYQASVAYALVSELRRLGLKGTEMERAQSGTIRLKLLKIGAQIRVSVRRVWLRLSSACPYQALVRTVVENIRKIYPLRV